MRKEYDFGQGTRGKHAAKSVRIVGDRKSRNGLETAVIIQRTIERDLKSREDFKEIWSELDAGQRENIRATWLKKISSVLAAQPDRSPRRP